jgi:hypothetical protein
MSPEDEDELEPPVQYGDELLRELIEIGREQIEKLDELICVDKGISATLTSFLTQWEAANTGPVDPAVKVILTWGEPQPIPKG